ncbi:MAG: hypothetical protein KZQ93_07910 [Candidatus Thiodiazotropha sp. (ex Monitilora ramsayi)]|nr:hypothetical protein [Candidatus Thiodiazotropha sp. (ex Monitilora ramsayi)]
MGISINPAAFLDFLVKRKFENKRKAAEYLETITEDAEHLVGVWRNIVDQLCSGKQSCQLSPEQLLKIEEHSYDNAPYYSRLMEFYRYLSVALDGKVEERWREDLISTISSLIRHREITTKDYEKAVKEIQRDSVFIDEDNNMSNLSSLIESVAVLEKEVASLRVLVATIKAL